MSNLKNFNNIFANLAESTYNNRPFNFPNVSLKKNQKGAGRETNVAIQKFYAGSESHQLYQIQTGAKRKSGRIHAENQS